MKYTPVNIAVTPPFRSPKLAALFYQRIFPLIFGPDEILSLDKKLLHSILPEGTPDSVNPLHQDGYAFWGVMLALQRVGVSYAASEYKEAEEGLIFLEKVFGVDTIESLRANVTENNIDWLAKFLYGQMKDFGLNPTTCELLGSQSNVSNRNTLDDADPCVVLTNLEIIDPDRLTWEEIVSIREDPESAIRLRRLRTFMFEQFDGKSMPYIEDKLGVLLDDYKSAARKHGASLIKASLGAVVSEKVLTGVGAGMLAAVTGAAVPLAAAIGAVATLGSALLEVRAIKLKSDVDASIAPIRFLVDIDKSNQA